MNARPLIAAAALAAFGMAHAEGPLEDDRVVFAPVAPAAAAPLTRDAVRAQIATAPEAVRALVTEAGVAIPARAMPGALTRAEVMAQARQAIASGEYFALTAEGQSFDGSTLVPSQDGIRLAQRGAR
jgi:hypothetical protein